MVALQSRAAVAGPPRGTALPSRTSPLEHRSRAALCTRSVRFRRRTCSPRGLGHFDVAAARTLYRIRRSPAGRRDFPVIAVRRVYFRIVDGNFLSMGVYVGSVDSYALRAIDPPWEAGHRACRA